MKGSKGVQMAGHERHVLYTRFALHAAAEPAIETRAGEPSALLLSSSDQVHFVVC